MLEIIPICLSTPRVEPDWLTPPQCHLQMVARHGFEHRRCHDISSCLCHILPAPCSNTLRKASIPLRRTTRLQTDTPSHRLIQNACLVHKVEPCPPGVTPCDSLFSKLLLGSAVDLRSKPRWGHGGSSLLPTIGTGSCGCRVPLDEVNC